jgi:hypothetical protein
MGWPLFLACFAGAAPFALFLIEKTPSTVIVLLFLMAVLLIYPIYRMVPSRVPQTALFCLTLLFLIGFGWHVWPKKKPEVPVATSVPRRRTPRNGTRVPRGPGGACLWPVLGDP